MLEAAIVLPILLLISMGIIQYGTIAAANTALHNGAIVGARQGSILLADGQSITDPGAGYNQIRDAVRTAMSGLVKDETQVAVLVDSTAASAAPPSAKITVQYGVPIIVPLVFSSSLGSFQLTSTAEMR